MAGRSTSLTVEILADASQAKRQLDSVADTASGLGGKLTKTLGGLALGAGILKFGSDSVKAAADAEQAVGGVAAVFKGQASQIEKAAQGAAKSIGLSTTAYEQLATVLGSQLKTAGFADFADKTKELIGLGADLAAQFGGTTSDAVSAISSLMKGERDPIERYGVSIKQAAVDAEILAEGLDTSTTAAKNHAQAQATLALLTNQTVDAQGAAAREVDTAAARYQQFTATLTDLEAQVGSALLPSLNGLLDVGLQLAPAIQLVGEALAAALGWVIDLPGPVLAVAAAFGAMFLLSGPLETLTKSVQGFRYEMMLTREISAANAVELGSFGAAARVAGEKAAGLGKALLSAVGGAPGLIIGAGIALIGGLFSALSKDSADAAAQAEKVASAVTSLGQAMLTLDVADDVTSALGTIKEAFGGNLGDAEKYAESLGLSVTDLVGVINGVPGALDKYNAALSAHRGALVGAAAANGDYISGTSGNAAAIQAQSDALETGELAMEGLSATSIVAAENNAAYAQTLKDAGLEIDPVTGQIKKIGGAMEDATAPGTDLGEAIKEMGAAAAAADQELKFLLLTIDQQNGGTLDLTIAANAADAAMREVGATSRDNAQAVADLATAQSDLAKLQSGEVKGSAEDVAEAQRKVADATDKVAGANADVISSGQQAASTAIAHALAVGQNEAAQHGLAAGADAANAVVEAQRHKFIDAQIAAGMEEQAAYDLAQQLFGIPGTVGTTINAQDNASDSIYWVDKRIGELDGQSATVKVSATPVGDLMNNLLTGNWGAIISGAPHSIAPPPTFAAPTFAALSQEGATLDAATLGASTLGDPTVTVPVVAVPIGLTGTAQAQVVNVTYNLTVNGALDADSTARQINDLLRSRDRRALAVTARRGMSI